MSVCVCFVFFVCSEASLDSNKLDQILEEQRLDFDEQFDDFFYERSGTQTIKDQR